MPVQQEICSNARHHTSNPFLRVILVLLIVLLAVPSGPARADNPYAVAGISDAAHVTQFLAQLKQAMTADDHAAMAMVKYPLTVHSLAGRPTTYRDAAALRANYARVLTPEVKAAVAAAHLTICSSAIRAS